MEGSPHKHKRTIAQDFLTKSLSQSIDLNLNRYSFNTDHSGPLTLRVTHLQASQEEAENSSTPSKAQDKMKKSSIQERPSSRTISNLKNNLLQLEQKLSMAHKQLNSSPNVSKRSTIGAQPYEFEKMLGLFVCNQVSEDESTINLESQKLLGIKSRQKIAFTSQMNTYYTGHLVKALIGANSTAVEHLSETIVAMKKAMIIRMPSQIEIQNKKIVLNCSPKDKRKTLLVELEQTLLHLVGKKEHENDVEVGTGSSKFYVSLRPYLFSFLKKIKQFYEIVIFTTLPTSRANQILEELDPDRKLIFDCLGSEHCSTIKNDASCKDIRIVNRSIKEMCLIDSKPNSLILHPENSIPILPYKGLQQDRELMQLQRFLLKQLLGAKDVRELLRQKFKLSRYWQYENWQNLVKQLYLD